MHTDAKTALAGHLMPTPLYCISNHLIGNNYFHDTRISAWKIVLHVRPVLAFPTDLSTGRTLATQQVEKPCQRNRSLCAETVMWL